MDLLVKTFESVAARGPQAVAVEGEASSVTYAALNGLANGVAAELVNRGIAPGQIAGIWLPPGIGYVSAFLGVLKAGGAVMPIDPAVPVRRLEAMLRVARPFVLLTDAAHLDAQRACLFSTGHDCPFVVIDDSATLEQAPQAGPDPDGLCYVMFTSGTTGTPRAIAGLHKSLAHFLHWEVSEFGLDSSCRGSWLAAPTFDVSLRDIFAPLVAGGTVCVPEDATRSSGRGLLDWLEAAQVTQVHCVPTLLRLLVRELPGRAKPCLPHLQRVLCAGEALHVETVRRWRDHLGARVEFVNLYGPTETTLAKMFYRIPADLDGRDEVVPLGRPLPDTDVFILGESRRSCEPGEAGEIAVCTQYRSRGYLNDPALTAERFVTNPLGGADEIVFLSGDRGRFRADGVVEFAGRKDDQVKIRGVRVELTDVEANILRHPDVTDAAVAVREGPGGEGCLWAYVVCAEHIDPRELRRFLEDYLPAAMMPETVIRMDRLPVSPHGKVDRASLPADAVSAGNGTPVSAQSETEEALAQIWFRSLGLQNVDVEESFLNLGGDSLKAMRAISAVYKVFGVEITLASLFRQGTIRNLARLIDVETSGRKGAD